MAAPIRLGITIHADGSAQVTGELNRVRGGLTETDRAAQNASRSFAQMARETMSLKSMLLGFAASVSFAALAKETLDVNRAFQSLRQSLVTTTGTAANAELAFSFIQDFAATTPYDVDQVTQAFIKLGNLGLKPSAEALRSYGNTASAQNKPIMQMIEAVADATVGEFERLKEFGIKAKTEGDKIKFTFQGATVEVANSASAIELYLIKLGSTKFGDAMAGQAKTMNGAISNLDDTWDMFIDHILLDVGENAIAHWVQDAGQAIKWLDVQINGAITNSDKLAEIDKRISANQKAINAHKNNGMIGALVDDFSGFDAGLKQNQIDADIKARAALTSEIAKQAAEQGKLIASMGKSSDASSTATSAAKKHHAALSDEQKSANALAREYQSIVDGLLKKIALGNDNSATAAMEYEVEAGALRGLTDAQKLYLLQKTAEAQNQELAEKAKKSEQDAMDDLIDKYNQLTLSAREYYSLTLLKKGVAPDKQAPLLQQFDKTTQAEAQQKSIDDARSALESYNAQLSSVRENLSGLGATSADVFNSSLGGINALSGAFNAMVDAIAKNTTALADLHKRQLQNADFEKKALTDEAKRKNFAQFLKDQKTVADNKIAYINEEAKLGNERLMAELGGIRQIATATGQMFAENTTARKAFNLVALAASVAERAADLAGLGVKAASAVLTQGQGDPYTAFARIAAMAAIVGSVIAAAGGGAFQFGGSVGKRPEVSSDTGTVLGDSTAKSESIDKTYQLLKYIHAEEYAELRGINSGISNLQSGITNTATNLFRAGGLNFDVALKNSTTPLLAKLAMFGPVGLALEKIPVVGGIIKGIGDFLFNGLFGKVTRKVVGGGITTNPALLGGAITGQQYTTIETTKKSWFSKKVSYSEVFSPLETEVALSLTQVFKNVAKTTNALGDTLFKQTGISFEEKIRNYIIPSLKIELYGLSGEQAAKKLSGVLSATTDKMATKIFGSVLGKFQQLGEGMLQTVVRITAEIAVVSDALALSGLKLSAENIIAGSDAIVQAAGSIQEFQKQVSSYTDKFYTDSERQALGLKSINTQLAVLGIALPATRDGYRKLIESLDINNKQDLERYSILIKLSSAADAYYETIESQTNTYAEAVASATDALTSAYKSQAEGINQTISKIDDFAQSIAKFRDELTIGDLSTNTPLQKYNAAKAQFEANQSAILSGPGTTDAARALYEQALSEMQSKSQNFLSASRVLNASGDTYTTDYQRVLAAIGSGIGAATEQKTEAENQLSALKSSVEGLVTFNENVLTVADALSQLATATAKQAAFISDQNAAAATAKSVAAAQLHNQKVLAYDKNYAGYNTGIKWDQLSAINAVYGNFTDALSAKDWEARGGIVAALLKDLNAQDAGKKPKHNVQWYIDQAQKIDGSHRDGLDYVPFDGYRAELHRGERVQTAQQARADDKLSAELLAELRALRAEVEKLRTENARRTEATIKSNFEATDRAADKVVAGHKDAVKESVWAARSKADIA